MMNHPSGIQPNTQTTSPAQPYHFHTDGIIVLGTGLGDAFVKATNASRFQTRIVPLLDAEDGGPTAATQIHNKLARFRAIVSIHSARRMASAVTHGANAAPADPDG